MADNNRGSFEHYQEAVYTRLRRYTFALDNQDDRVIAILARAELPRYVRYWVALLAKHEPTASGKCPTCSRWWRTVPVSVRHVEMGAWVPDRHTSTSHRAIKPD
jgi:hypothetical protein